MIVRSITSEVISTPTTSGTASLRGFGDVLLDDVDLAEGVGRVRAAKPGLVQCTVSSGTRASGVPPTSAASVWVTVRRSFQTGGGVVLDALVRLAG